MTSRRLVHKAGLAGAVLAAVLGSGAAFGTEVASWTDEHGVTHFGDPQFAPPTATIVEVGPANGMTAPTGVSWGGADGPRFVRIPLAPKQNKRGWRGRGYTVSSGAFRSGANTRIRLRR